MHDIIYETKKKNIPSRFFFEEMDSSQFPNGRTMTVPIGDQLTISGNKRNGYEAGVYFDDQRQPTRNFSIPGVNYYFDGTANREPSVLGGNGATFHQHANVIRTSAKDVHFTLKKFANNFHQMWIPGQWIFSLNNIGATELSHAEYPRINTIYPSPAATVGVTPIQLNAILAEAEKKCNAAYQEEKGSLSAHSVISTPARVGGRYDVGEETAVGEIRKAQQDFINLVKDQLKEEVNPFADDTTRRIIDPTWAEVLTKFRRLFTEQSNKISSIFQNTDIDASLAFARALGFDTGEANQLQSFVNMVHDIAWGDPPLVVADARKSFEKLFSKQWNNIPPFKSSALPLSEASSSAPPPSQASSSAPKAVSASPVAPSFIELKKSQTQFDTKFPLLSLYSELDEVEWSERDGSKIKSDDAKIVQRKKDVIEAADKSLPSLGWCNGYFILNHVRLLGVVDSIQDSTEHGRVDVSIAVCGGTHTMNFWGPFLEHGDRAGFMINKVDPEKFDPLDFNPFQVIAYRNPMAFVPGIPIDRSGKSEKAATSNSNYPKSAKTDYAYPRGDDKNKPPRRNPAISFRAGIVSRRDPVDYVGLADCDATSTYARQCVDLLGPSTIATDAGLPRSDPAYTIAMADSTARVVYMHVATS